MNSFQKPKKTTVLEKRQYFEDSSAEVIEAIKDHVTILSDNIILIKEVPYPSSFSCTILMEEAASKKEALDFEKFYLIIDVRNTQRPNSETRRKLNDLIVKFCHDVIHVSFLTGKSPILNTAIKFVMFQTKLSSFSIDKNIEEALNSFRKKANG